MDFNIKIGKYKRKIYLIFIKKIVGKLGKKTQMEFAKREIYQFQGKTSALNITNKIKHYF